MDVLFWNINNKPLGSALHELVSTYDVDVLILAECSMSDAEVLLSVNQTGPRTFTLPFSPSGRLRFFTRLNPETLNPLTDMAGASIRHLIPPLGDDLILTAVHLSSKLYYEQTDQLLTATRLAAEITNAENRVGHDRTIVIGDFNMNPFEPGLVAADALHSVMDRPTANELKRTVQGQARKFFFNPMWSRFGEESKGPPGTYYYRANGQICYFWNMFDQVLVRPSLLPYFSDEDLKIITDIRGRSLLDGHGRPDRVNYSDHLPLLLHLNIERSVTYAT